MEYMDDFVFMASSPSAPMLLLHQNDAVPGILFGFTLLSLPVNLAPDKTAGMIRFAGEGADSSGPISQSNRTSCTCPWK
eukprot:7921049-Prorocentrum_lima.AAC.1